MNQLNINNPSPVLHKLHVICVKVNEQTAVEFVRGRAQYLDGEQSGEIYLSDGFGHGFVLYTASLRFHLIQLIGRSHQVKNFIILQQGVSCEFRGRECINDSLSDGSHLESRLPLTLFMFILNLVV